MSKIGSWILEQERLTEMYNRYHNPETEEVNEAYYEYLLFGHRNNSGSPDDLVCSNKAEREGTGSHWTRFLEECAE